MLNLKKRLGQIDAIKEEDFLKAESSGNEEQKEHTKKLMLSDSEEENPAHRGDEDNDDDDDVNGGVPEQDLGPLAQVSLLDQHNVLKKKAEGLYNSRFGYIIYAQNNSLSSHKKVSSS